MTTRIDSSDAHLQPNYLKFAADCFHNDKALEGQQFFKLACKTPRALEYKVYWHMQDLMKPTTDDPEFGRKAFHHLNDISSPTQTKAEAIFRTLRDVDNHFSFL